MNLLKTILLVMGFVLFLGSAVLMFEPMDGPTGFFVYTPTLAILDAPGSVELNSHAEIRFITKGSDDLTADVGLGNAEIIEIRCEDEGMEHADQGDRFAVKDFSCSGESILSAKIMSSEARIDLEFGNRKQSVTIRTE